MLVKNKYTALLPFNSQGACWLSKTHFKQKWQRRNINNVVVFFFFYNRANWFFNLNRNVVSLYFLLFFFHCLFLHLLCISICGRIYCFNSTFLIEFNHAFSIFFLMYSNVFLLLLYFANFETATKPFISLPFFKCALNKQIILQLATRRQSRATPGSSASWCPVAGTRPWVARREPCSGPPRATVGSRTHRRTRSQVGSVCFTTLYVDRRCEFHTESCSWLCYLFKLYTVLSLGTNKVSQVVVLNENSVAVTQRKLM